MIKVASSAPHGVFSVILPIKGMFVQEDGDLYHNRI